MNVPSCVRKFIRTVVCECRDIYYTLYVRVQRHSIQVFLVFCLFVCFEHFNKLMTFLNLTN